MHFIFAFVVAYKKLTKTILFSFKECITKEYTMNIKMLKTALVGLVISVSGFANAGLIEFSDRASFETAIGTSTTIDFEADLQSSWTYNTNFVEGNVVITPSSNYQYIGDFDELSNNNNQWNTWGSDFLLGEAVGHTIQFNTAVNAFGLDFGGNGNGTFNFQLDNGEQFSATSSGQFGEYNFIGVTSTSSFTSVTWSSSNSRIAADNIIYSTIDVPEPSTLAIFALGIMGLASRKFKKQ